jgi:hypothetical protein
LVPGLPGNLSHDGAEAEMTDLTPKFIDYSGSQFSGKHTYGDHSLDL